MLGGGIILIANAANALNAVAVGLETNLAGLFAMLAGALPIIFTATVAIGSLAAVFYAIYSASPGG
jgi:hypothetical protein